MRTALQTHDQIIWTDWDLKLIKPLQPDFWDRFSIGQSLQAQLFFYRSTRRDSVIVPSGAFIYCRDRGPIDRAIEIHSELYREESDEVALGHLFNELSDGWQNHYRAGFGLDCYVTRRVLKLPEPERVYFLTGCKHAGREQVGAGMDSGS